MPSIPADPWRAPIDEPVFIDDPTMGPHGWGGGGGGGGGVFNPGPSTFGGGGSMYGGGAPYANFQGYGDTRRRRPGMRQPYGSSSMTASRAPSVPSRLPSGEITDYGDDYFGGILRNRFGGEDTGYAHASGSDMEALLDWVISGKSRGMFGPEGDPRIREMMEGRANRRGLEMENAAVLGARMDGGDPWNAGLARTLARNSASAGKWNMMSDLEMENARRYGDLFDFAVKHKTGEYDAGKAREWGLADRDHDARQGGGWGSMVGGLLGTGLGSFAGGYGASLGGQLGSKIGGGMKNASTYPRYDYLRSGRTY